MRAFESYEDAVVREAEEEAGITAQPIFIDSFKKRIPEEKENVKVYALVARDDITLNKEELEKGEFLGMDELEEILNRHNFLPETEKLLGTLKAYLSSQSLQNI